MGCREDYDGPRGNDNEELRHVRDVLGQHVVDELDRGPDGQRNEAGQPDAGHADGDGDHADRTATWQGMKIQARVMAPSTFILLESGKQQMVKPTAKDSFHLMVILNDAKSGTPIPYSSVWATITRMG